MKQIDLTVRCIYAETGETAMRLILRAFTFFLRRELGKTEKTAAHGLSPGH